MRGGWGRRLGRGFMIIRAIHSLASFLAQFFSHESVSVFRLFTRVRICRCTIVPQGLNTLILYSSGYFTKRKRED